MKSHTKELAPSLPDYATPQGSASQANPASILDGSLAILPEAGPWALLPLLERGQDQGQAPRLTSASWKSPVTGSWATKANWSNGAVPTSQTDTTIAVAGTYTVNINTTSAAHSLTINDKSAKVDDTAVFTMGSTLAVTAGTFTLDSGGTIQGGTISTGTNGTFLCAGGTLNGVAFDGTLNVTYEPVEFAGTSLTVTGATSFAGAGGSGLGTINLASTNLGGDAYLYALGNYTLNSAVLNIGSDDYFTSATLYNEDVAGGATLTLGPSLTINLTNLEAAIGSDNQASDAIVNRGTINAGIAGGVLYIDATSFTNSGVINVSNTSEIVLSGTATASLINGINRTTGGLIGIGSVVNGGTINASQPGIISAGGTLNGVAFDGTLNVTYEPVEFAGTSLTVTGATTFTGAGGSELGTINLASTNIGGDAYLYALGNYTLNNAVLNIGSDDFSTSATLYNEDVAGGATLTLGPSLTINLTNLEAAIASSGNARDTVINQGIIDAAFSGGILTISATTFTNSGTVTAGSGGTLAITSTKFTNLQGGTLVGGTYEADAGSATQFANGTSITTDQATIILSGAGSVIEALNRVGTTEVSLDTTLTTIAAAGTLELLAGRSFTALTGFSDAGLLQIGSGATLAASGSLSVTSTGSLRGNGTVTAALVNAGNIEAKNGTLLLSGNVTGTGTLQVDTGAVLDIGGTVASSQTASFSGQGGVLKLENAASFMGPIANYGPGDAINIGTVVATSAVISGSALNIGLSNGGTLSYALTNTPANERASISADGHSITAYREAVASLANPTITFGNHHVGDSVSQGVSLTNTASADGYSEALDAGFAGSSGSVSGSGTLTGLMPGATNSTALQLMLNTTAAGAASGSATIGVYSDGAGSDGLGTIALPSQIVTATGAVFAYAQGGVAQSTLNFGIVHVGATVSQALSLTNTGPATGGYTEALDASLSGATSGVKASGSVSLLAQGATNTTSLLVGLNTATAAVVTGTATLGLTSDGTGIDGLGNTALASQQVAVTGTVDNYAKEQLFRVSGTTGIGIANHATISLGTVAIGAAGPSVSLGVINYVSGPADVLGGSFTETGSGFTNTGFVSFANLGAQQNEHQQKVTLKTTTAGSFSETIQVSGTGSNASGYSGALATQTITITGTVTAGTVLQAGSGVDYGGSAMRFLLGSQPTASGAAATPGPVELAAQPSLAELISGLSGSVAAPASVDGWGRIEPYASACPTQCRGVATGAPKRRTPSSMSRWSEAASSLAGERPLLQRGFLPSATANATRCRSTTTWKPT